jgi:hypothetical protein
VVPPLPTPEPPLPVEPPGPLGLEEQPAASKPTIING